MEILKELAAYVPQNEQEEKDRTLILDFIERNADAFLRSNRIAHVTASAWVTNPARDKVLMVYHKIYDSWSWCGGHADGDRDLLHVALKECQEETGLTEVKPVDGKIYSVECLTVDGHEKRGRYVPSHLHLNLTYLLEADEHELLAVKPDENSAVAWFGREEAVEASSEPWFRARVYSKLNAKLARL